MSWNIALWRMIPGLIALCGSAGAMLYGLTRLSSGSDANGLYWVVVGILVLSGIRSRSNSVSRE